MLKVREVGVREFRGNLTAFLQHVKEGGSLMITSHDRVIAEVRPPSIVVASRQPGALRDKIILAPDFDQLPADVLAAMEGDE